MGRDRLAISLAQSHWCESRPVLVNRPVLPLCFNMMAVIALASAFLATADCLSVGISRLRDGDPARPGGLRQVTGNPRRGKFGAAHETKHGAEAVRRHRPGKIESGNCGLEVGREPRCIGNRLDLTANPFAQEA